MAPRCRSTCTTNKTPQSCAEADKCAYTNGEKRKFCRLSTKYKMNKPGCNITRKFLKREKKPAEIIGNFLWNRRKTLRNKRMILTDKEHTHKISEFTNKVQSRRLARFMRSVDPHKRRARFLNGVCSDSGVCIAFGKEVNKIKEHFDGFVNFDNVKQIRKIGEISANGFVKEIEYERAGYTAHAILKSSVRMNSDNLYYEYLVGQFINMIGQILPNFVETYAA